MSGCAFAVELHNATCKMTFAITRSEHFFNLFCFFFLSSSHEPFLPPDLGGRPMMASDAELIKEQS